MSRIRVRCVENCVRDLFLSCLLQAYSQHDFEPAVAEPVHAVDHEVERPPSAVSAKAVLPPLDLNAVARARPMTAGGRRGASPGNLVSQTARPQTVPGLSPQSSRRQGSRTQRAAPTPRAQAPRQSWWDGTTFDPDGTLEAFNAAAAFVAGGPLPLPPVGTLPQLSGRRQSSSTAAKPDSIETLRERNMLALLQSPYAAHMARRPPPDPRRLRQFSQTGTPRGPPDLGAPVRAQQRQCNFPSRRARISVCHAPAFPEVASEKRSASSLRLLYPQQTTGDHSHARRRAPAPPLDA